LESEPLTEDESASSAHSVSEELDAKTPTVAERSTYLTEKSEHDADLEDDEDVEEDDDGSTEEEDDDVEGSEEEEEDDEEEEPALKYERIGKAAAEILEKDTASAIAVGETYFVSLVYDFIHYKGVLNRYFNAGCRYPQWIGSPVLY